MNTPHDGGPAFPVLRENNNPNMPLIMASSGMSLRDWFAGQALAGLMVNYHDHPNNAEECAQLSFDAADAMLAAREKTKQ